ncbi:MAG: nuclear transport factor 2 family protein [Candidatus Dadabacteria bacterium]|nr:nuclear transport factor 2 family protein [Candidatus Dadabacteria bacterium]
MRETLIVTLMLLVGSLTFQITQSIAHPWTESEIVIVNLEQNYFEALKNQDQELMDSLLHENFVISSMTRMTSPSLDKQTFLTTLPKQIITFQEITHVKVNIKGNMAKSVVNISMIKTYDGKDHSGDYEVYSIWVKEGGNWELLDRRIKFIEPS